MKKILSIFAIMLVSCGALKAQSISPSITLWDSPVAISLISFPMQASEEQVSNSVRWSSEHRRWTYLRLECILRGTFKRHLYCGTSNVDGKQFRYSNHFPMLLVLILFQPGESSIRLPDLALEQSTQEGIPT
jgi:hypothetical protein